MVAHRGWTGPPPSHTAPPLEPTVLAVGSWSIRPLTVNCPAPYLDGMKSWFVHHTGATTLVVIVMALLGMLGVTALAYGDVVRGFILCFAAVTLFGLVEDAIRRD